MVFLINILTIIHFIFHKETVLILYIFVSVGFLTIAWKNIVKNTNIEIVKIINHFFSIMIGMLTIYEIYLDIAKKDLPVDFQNLPIYIVFIFGALMIYKIYKIKWK